VTFGEIQTAVNEALGFTSGSAKVTRVQGYINQEYLRLAAEFKLDYATDVGLAVTANTELVTLPADLTRIETIRHDGTTLIRRDAPDLARLAAARVAASATATGPVWYDYDGPLGIRIEPPFGATYTAPNSPLTLRYVVGATVMTAAGNTPTILPAPYHQILVEYALYRMANAEESHTQAADAQAEYQRLAAGLREHVVTRQGVPDGRIRRRHYG
jgi:hypothetical protein